ncbi:MAG: alpha-glucan family phosphorylase, partial [Vampirovibrionales bacterium]
MPLPKVGYFSMEIAVDQSIHTYSGGLGFLAGSHMLSAGQLNLPMVGVTMLWTYGYGEQRINEKNEVEITYSPNYHSFLEDTGVFVEITIFGRPVKVTAKKLRPEVFGSVPIYFLTTDVEGAPEIDRVLSHKLYDSDHHIRVAQEIILGVGGYRLLQAVGEPIDIIHLNEGHALPACFEVLRQNGGNLEALRQNCVFTTHTPVAAGNEVHPAPLLAETGFFVETPFEEAVRLGGHDFSLTVAALRMSRMSNGVSQLHAHVANRMWNWVEGRCPIIGITNAVNQKYWQDARVPEAKTDEQLLTLKKTMKQELFDFIEETRGVKLNKDVFTIVWARRFTEYKRADLIFRDFERIKNLLVNNKVQLIYAGKFHPKDTWGQQTYNKMLAYSKELPNLVVIPTYELELSAKLKQG